MGGVNFLGNNKTIDNKDSSANSKKNYRDFEWTKPEKQEEAERNSDRGLSVNRKMVLEQEKNSSGNVISESNSSNKRPQNLDQGSFKRKIRDNFLSRFFGFGRSQKKENLSNDDLVNRKKVIADLGEAVHEERIARKNYKDNGIGDETFSASEAEQMSSQQVKSNDSGKGLSPNRWQAPQILKTDLIKDELTIFIDWKKNISYLFINLILVILISLIAYAGIKYWGQGKAEQVKALDKEILDLSEKINSFDQEKIEIDSWQKKLSLISKTLDDHIYWTNFFSYMEKDTLADVYYVGDFKGDLTGKFSFGARANKFEDISNQVRVLKADKEFVNSVEVNEGVLSGDFDKKSRAAGAGNIEFQMDLTVNPDILYKK